MSSIKKLKETQNYLKYIAFALSQKFSFCQISNLGHFLKNLAHEKDDVGLSFFASQSLDRELIANIATDCFRPYLIDKLQQDLLSTKFSFSIDTSTMSGENICVIRARFLEKKFDHEFGQEITEIQNKIIGIKKLNDSRNAQNMLELVREKVFFNSNKIIMDRASNFSGDENGLEALLKRDIKPHIFDLPDPCHSFNLVTQNSLDTLPEDIRSFIGNVHNYFSSPQRKERLKKIQKANGFKPLLLKQYAKTRWLSLGDSLERLIEIWPSLLIYFNTIALEKKKNKIKLKYEEDIEINNVN